MKKPRFKSKVTVYVLIFQDKKILMLRRSGTGIADGEYAIPMGGVEKGETLIEAAIREVKEEVGLDISCDQLEFTHVMYRLNSEDRGTNPEDWMAENADFYFTCTSFEGVPFNAEPHKHDRVEFFPCHALPFPLVKHIKVALEQIDTKNTLSHYGWNLNKASAQ
ncbi:NUDIX domain-containing protein [Candidatus Bealeia paramacronuclearis]|uniref:NUDIX domain-containing protein n=1 Tax=Candidatus Bealeia paramacronuclearis TaxID=1921001 RepID=A0ABZ2C424_9PROT|nr:NUDIX domain-containing protein [Candidatus Bealeia paramacronuclearis]